MAYNEQTDTQTHTHRETEPNLQTATIARHCKERKLIRGKYGPATRRAMAARLVCVGLRLVFCVVFLLSVPLLSNSIRLPVFVRMKDFCFPPITTARFCFRTLAFTSIDAICPPGRHCCNVVVMYGRWRKLLTQRGHKWFTFIRNDAMEQQTKQRKKSRDATRVHIFPLHR